MNPNDIFSQFFGGGGPFSGGHFGGNRLQGFLDIIKHSNTVILARIKELKLESVFPK